MAYVWKDRRTEAQKAAVEAPPAAVKVAPEPKVRTPKEPEPFDPSRCGTPGGYKQHRRHNLEPCKECLASAAEYSREWRLRALRSPIVKGFKPGKCGTYAGYARHQRSDVPTCGPCAEAHAEYMRGYNARRKAAEQAPERMAA